MILAFTQPIIFQVHDLTKTFVLLNVSVTGIKKKPERMSEGAPLRERESPNRTLR